MQLTSLARVALVLSPLAVFGCGGEKAAPTAKADEFLKWSMDQHKELSSFQADANWTVTASSSPTPQVFTRTIAYSAPDKFKITAKQETGPVLTVVSDGKSYVEYSSDKNFKGASYPAPKSIAEATGMAMDHPMGCGTLLYGFFGGSKNIGKVVDLSKGAITFGTDETSASGEPSKLVKFYASGMYGHTEALIGTKTGMIHRMKYDFEPVLKQGNAPAGSKLEIVEKYTKQKENEPIALTAFDTKPPAGVQVVDAASGASKNDVPPPPVPVGSMAPKINVASLADGSVATSDSLKGKVVMLDFWATWCGPCVEGLPTTIKMHEKYGSKGLAVLAITSEDKATVTPFLTKHGFKLPVYLDPGSKANDIYKVDVIPTLIILDKAGKLVYHTVGVPTEEEVVAALKMAGVQTD